MMQISSDKYTAAWFKLADIIARGDKERALGVYRLLSYSLTDRAFAIQLEADILWAFHDGNAVQKYKDAAWNYYDAGRFFQAIAVYEHLIELSPHEQNYLVTLTEWYTRLDLSDKAFIIRRKLFDLYINYDNINKASDLLVEMELDFGITEPIIIAHKRIVFYLLQREKSLNHKVLVHIKTILDWCLKNTKKGQQILHTFLEELEEIDNEYYLMACQYMEEESLKDKV